MTLEPGQPNQAGEASPGPLASAPPPFPPTGEPPATDGPSREYRARIAFTIGGLFGLVVSLLLFGNVLSILSSIPGLLLFVSAFLSVFAMLAEAYGLGARRDWAVAVATPMLVILVIEGVIETLAALTHSTLHIPIGAILGVWALLAPLRTPIDPAVGSRPWGTTGTLVLGALVFTALFPTLVAMLSR